MRRQNDNRNLPAEMFYTPGFPGPLPLAGLVKCGQCIIVRTALASSLCGLCISLCVH